jgi:hypothetical protein
MKQILGYALVAAIALYLVLSLPYGSPIIPVERLGLNTGAGLRRVFLAFLIVFAGFGLCLGWLAPALRKNRSLRRPGSDK